MDYNPGRYIRLEPLPSPHADIRDFRADLRACTDDAVSGEDSDHYSEQKFLQVSRIIERFRGREGLTEADRRWTRFVTDVRNWYTFAASERYREDDTEYEHYADSGGKSGGQKEKLAYTILAASLAYQFKLEWGAAKSRTFRFAVIDEAFGRGSDESTRFALELFGRLGLQLLIVTPLQKIHVIEPYVSAVGFVDNPNEQRLATADADDRGVPGAAYRAPDRPADGAAIDWSARWRLTVVTATDRGRAADAAACGTRPADVRAAIRKKWDSGSLLARFAGGQDWAPLGIPIRGPSARQIGEQLAEVRQWAAEWAARRRRAAARGVQAGRRQALRREQHPVPGLAGRLRRSLGAAEGGPRGAPPGRADRGGPWHPPGPVADRPPDAGAAARGRLGPAAGHRPLDRAAPGARHVPAAGRCARRRHQVHRAAQGCAHRTARRPARPVPRRGRRGRLRRALRLPAASRVTSGSGWPEVSVDSPSCLSGPSEFTAAPEGITRAYVIENEITYLAFPIPAAAMVILGGGYAVPVLEPLGWLAGLDVVVLGRHRHARLRDPQPAAPPPAARPLHAHGPGHPAGPPGRTGPPSRPRPPRPLERLDAAESALYADLISDAYAPSVRLEQERISFAAIEKALADR